MSQIAQPQEFVVARDGDDVAFHIKDVGTLKMPGSAALGLARLLIKQVNDIEKHPATRWPLARVKE